MGTHVKKFETFLVAPTSFMNKNLSIFKNTFVNVTGMVFFRFNRSWFERMLSWNNGRTATKMRARRYYRWLIKWRAKQHKSVSSIPSSVGHIGFMVSLTMCLHLWKFNLLRQTLIWERYDTLIGSWIPTMDFAGGRVTDRSLDLNIAMDDTFLISGSSLFHSDVCSWDKS